jgi:hypothetical protein
MTAEATFLFKTRLPAVALAKAGLRPKIYQGNDRCKYESHRW